MKAYLLLVTTFLILVSSCTLKQVEHQDIVQDYEYPNMVEVDDFERQMLDILEYASRGEVERAEVLLDEIGDPSKTLVGVLSFWHRFRYSDGEDVRLVNYLLQGGADPNGTDEEGTPVLLLARTAAMLKALGDDERTDLHVKEPGGATPLIYAIGYYDLERVTYLLDLGVDPNATGKTGHGGKTAPIFDAILWDAHRDDSAILERLLADPRLDLSVIYEDHNISSAYGFDPIQFAEEVGREDLAQLMRKHAHHYIQFSSTLTSSFNIVTTENPDAPSV